MADEKIKFSRVWAMPNRNTFSIKPIAELIQRYTQQYTNGELIIDPFANTSRIANITNDLDPAFDTHCHMDALDFLKMFDNESIEMCLYDPPYSVRQVSECYRALGRTVNMKTTQSSYWANQKKEMSRIVKPGGVVISCGWNSGGIGTTNGFTMLEILLVPHGGPHNDTIVTVERKREKQNG